MLKFLHDPACKSDVWVAAQLCRAENFQQASCRGDEVDYRVLSYETKETISPANIVWISEKDAHIILPILQAFCPGHQKKG